MIPKPMEEDLCGKKYHVVTHMGSAIMWNGRSYMSKPGEVQCGINANNDLVVCYINMKATVISHMSKRVSGFIHPEDVTNASNTHTNTSKSTQKTSVDR
jgi:hypothetical protein